MDITGLTALATCINLAKDIGKTAIGLRDANLLTNVVSQMNEQILKAQDSLFAHNSQLLELQQQYFEATQELRVMKEAAAERSRYTLFEVTPGSHVYRADARPVPSGTGNPITTEPEHYICQPCFDNAPKIKAVLRFIPERAARGGTRYLAHWLCPVCKGAIVKRGN